MSLESTKADSPRRWRAAVLRSAGFAPQLARELADDPRYQVHELLELVEHGCPPALAWRVVAPLGE